jgi:lipoprotein LprG
MSDVTSAHFSLKIDGSLSTLPVRSAEGDTARTGQTSATANLDIGGNLIQYTILITGGNAYLKGPTGGYTKVPVSTIYDPSRLLDPTAGLAAVLGKATNGTTEASEQVDGVSAYRVRAKIPGNVLEGLTTLAPGQDTLNATLWIAADGSRLLKATIPFRSVNASKDTVVTATLSNFNAPVSVQTPTA